MAENRKKACHSRGNISQKGCSLLELLCMVGKRHNFQQFSCRTYALTPYGSKVMVHEVFYSQYQGYGKKIL
jgi:hypothetical protein